MRRGISVPMLGLCLAAMVGCGGGATEEADGTTTAPEDVTTTTAEDDTSTTQSEDTTTTGGSQGSASLPFEDGFDDDRNGWDPQSIPQVGLAIDSGFYAMAYNADPEAFVEYFPDVLVDAAEAGDLAGVFVEATVSFQSPAAAIVACHVDPDLTAQSPGGYFFSADSSGHLAISKREVDGAVTKLATTNPDGGDPFATASPHPFTVGESLDLGAECNTTADGVELSLFLNGVPALDAFDVTDPWPPGIVEIVGAISGAALQRDGFTPFNILWDNVFIETV